MKKFLYLFFSHYQIVRKFLGGKWAKDRREGYCWVSWNHCEKDIEEALGFITWPLNPKEYECECWE